MLAVDVRFGASANDGSTRATGNVQTVVLELDGREVGRYANPARVKEGSYRFTVALGNVPEGAHTLRAFAYQGNERAALRAESTAVQLLLDRTPPALDLTAPVDGIFVRGPSVGVAGSARDELSGLASITCAGREVAVAASFSCDAALVEGANELVVRAVDRAGNERTRRVSVDRFGGGLAGPSGAPAVAAVEDVFTPEAYVVPAESTGSTVRTQIELVFARDATVGQVNTLLRSIGGRIVSQREGVLIAVVRIPDPGGLAALDALLASLAASPGLRAANPVALAATGELPAIIDAGTGEVALVRHQLAVRAHAAWNARAALDSATPPAFVIADDFGDGPPGELFGLNVRDADYAEGLATTGHGYHVLGIAATSFDPTGGSFFADAVTGMYPGSLDVRAVDQRLGLASPTTQDRLLEEVEEASGNVVVNTSLQAACETAADNERFCTDDAARARGLSWLERVRGTDPARSLEGKFVHVTAAGNRAAGIGTNDASIGGWDAASAALYPIFVGGGADPLVRVPNLTNTLVVENFESTDAEPFAPACRSASSDAGGTLAAMGESVISFVSPTTTGTLSGTSMATPQVAGLAAYVWALRPSLSPTELIALLRRTGTAADASCGSAPPVIDAYAALLAADEGGAAWPVRSAILDVADGAGEPGENGSFDEADLALHFDKLAAGAGAIDYGRHDLNGDGRTGTEPDTTRTARLDLDADGSYGTIEQEVEGVTVRYDEARVSDRKALCYYAYSALYDGDPGARTATLGLPECVRLAVDGLFPTSVQPGVANALTVVVTDRDLPGSSAPRGQGGVRVELTPTGGTVGDFAGTTNSEGVFRTTATAFTGQPLLQIQIVVRAPEGTELARTSVAATLSGGFDLRGIWVGGGTCGDTFFQADVRVTRTIAGELAASVGATSFDRGLIARQRGFGTWILDERPDGEFTSNETVTGLSDTISLRLNAVGSGRFGAGVLSVRVTSELLTGPCREAGSVYEFTAELQQR